MKFPKEPPKLEKKSIDIILEILRKYKDDKEFGDLTSKYNEKYLYWEELIYKDISQNIIKEDLWHIMKFHRSRNLKVIKIGEYIFEFNLTNEISKKLHDFDLNLGGSLSSNKSISNEDKERFLINSIIEESINSSRLEGASTTFDVAKDMILSKKRPKDKSQKMILNNYLGMRKILDLKGEKLTKTILFELHEIITKDTLEKKEFEGEFRKNNDIKVIDKMTGEIFHTPPKHDELEKLIEEFCYFYNNEQEFFIHPIVKANILHFLLGFIHPFYDGNGRTARCVFFLYLISKDYWLFEYLSISRIIIKSPSQYAKAFIHSELDDNDLTYFIKYKTEKIEIAFKELKEYIERKMKEKTDSMAFLKFKGVTERQAQILGFYKNDKNRSFSVLILASKFGITKQTARADLKNLVKLKFLEEKKSGNKVLYIRSDKFKKIE